MELRGLLVEETVTMPKIVAHPEMELTIYVIKRANVLLRIWHSIAPAVTFFRFVFSLSEIPATYKYDVTVTIREQKK
jgi:hypothetical protein